MSKRNAHNRKSRVTDKKREQTRAAQRGFLSRFRSAGELSHYMSELAKQPRGRKQ